ncbi:MAG: hypothetical protein AB1815_11215 [Bacillota bacterium]
MAEHLTRELFRAKQPPAPSGRQRDTRKTLYGHCAAARYIPELPQ